MRVVAFLLLVVARAWGAGDVGASVSDACEEAEVHTAQGLGWCWGVDKNSAGEGARFEVSIEHVLGESIRSFWELRSLRRHLYAVAFVLDERRELARRPDGSAVWSSVRKLRPNSTLTVVGEVKPEWTIHVLVASNAIEESAPTRCVVRVRAEAPVLEALPTVGGYRGVPRPLLPKRRFGLQRGSGYSKLLAIDGGGARGVVPLAVLAEIERETGTRARESFDMIAGTSTGAVVAACLALAELPVQVVQSLYADLTRLIFGSRGLSAMQRARRLEAVLDAVFGAESRLMDVEQGSGVACIIIATDASTIPLRPFVFRNFAVPDQGGCFLSDAGSEKARVVDALLASTAAPPYFPRRNCSVDGVPRRLLDGALVANNPTHFALAELASLNEANDPLDLVVSLGTGVAPARARRDFELTGHNHLTSTLDFFEGLVSLLTDVDATHDLVRRSLRSVWREHFHDRYHRLDAVLDSRQLRLDEGDDFALRDLRLLAVDYFKRDKAREWHSLITALQKRGGPTAAIQKPGPLDRTNLDDNDDIYQIVEIPPPGAASNWLRPLRKKTAKLTGFHGFFSGKKLPMLPGTTTSTKVASNKRQPGGY